jgi:HK97 family phage major capsid protein
MRGVDLFEMFRSMETSRRNAPVRPTRSAGSSNRPPLVDHMKRTGIDGTRALHLVLHSVNEARKAKGEPAITLGQMKGEGFSTLGEQLRAIAEACSVGGRADRNLIRAPTFPARVRAPTGLGEVDPSAGGFLVGTQWANELVGFAYEQATLPDLCDRRQMTTPLADMKIPAIDETSRADGSRWGGALAYWLAEASTITATYPKFKNLAFSAKKLVVAIFVTNELLGDVPMLEAHIRRVFAAELGFKIDLGILAGDGAGKLLGMINSPCTITVPKETGQSAASLVTENINKMFSRLPAPSRRRAVWLVNEDIDQQLDTLVNVVGGAGATPPSASALYVPTGAAGNEFPLLKGRPVLTMEQCSLTGTPGDIVLADPEHYILIDGGVTPVLSVEVEFLTDSSVWRFVLRCDGQPAFASPITPYNGSSNTRSPFVALAAR